MTQDSFLTDVGIVLGVGAITSVVARLLRLPTVLGYLFAGLIVGPFVPFPFFADPHRVHTLSEFGVVLVMFAIGLEFRLGRFLRSLPVTGLTGLVEVGTLLYVGFTLGTAFGWSTMTSLFLGGSIAISSTMVVSKVFEQQPVAKDVREHVLSVLIFQDVIAIVLIAALAGVARGGELAPGELLLLLVRLAGVLVAMVVVGLWVLPRVLALVLRLESPEITTVFAVGLCFVLALVAKAAGFSVALGAFIGGIVVAECGRAHEVEHLIEPVRDIFVAIFFVSIGMSVDPEAAWIGLPAALLVSAAVIGAQLGSVSIAGMLSGLGLGRSVRAGLSLGQIGEFGFIIAGIGIGAGVADPSLQALVVSVAVITTLTTPLIIGQADRVVGWLDQLVPAPFQHLLSLYEGWLENLRATERHGPSPIRSTIRLIVLDTLLFVGIVAAALAWSPVLVGHVNDVLPGDRGVAWLSVLVVVILACSPFIYGFVRNAIQLATLVSDAVLRASPPVRAPGSLLVQHAIRAIVLFAVALGAGLPTIAILRPLLPIPLGAPLLLAALLALGVVLSRRAREFDEAYRSGSAFVANRLATLASARPDIADPTPALQANEGDADTGAILLPGLDRAQPVRVPDGSAVVGHSFRELQIRSLTGAHVVAIDRGIERIVLPTGSVRVEAGDILGLVGTTESIEHARTLLGAGPS